MSKHSRHSVRIDNGLLEVKSKFAAEFRRFSIPKSECSSYEKFKNSVAKLHLITDIPFTISYIDPRDNDLLPINNDDNLARALLIAKPLLRLIVQRKGESLEELNGYGTFKPKNLISSILGTTPGKSKSHLPISNPHDFRQVSAIIDVDILPETYRRVRLLKHGSDKPLGFYIRDGTSVRITPSGLEKVPGIFISRLVPGGLAESTGLLAVNDEVIEVNGIEVAGKTLDQVTDMMVANSWNLIVTVKPANQRATAQASGGATVARRGSYSRNSQLSSDSRQSARSHSHSHSQPSSSDGCSHDHDDPDDHDDHDEIVDLTGITFDDSTSGTVTVSGKSDHDVVDGNVPGILHL